MAVGSSCDQSVPVAATAIEIMGHMRDKGSATNNPDTSEEKDRLDITDRDFHWQWGEGTDEMHVGFTTIYTGD